MFFSGIADEAGEAIEMQISAHQELGWDHVEVRNVDGVNLTDLCDELFDRTVEKLDRAGLKISCFASQLCNWSRPISKHVDIDVDELRRAIPRMQRVGCKFIRIMSYPNAGWPQQEWSDEVVRRIKMLAQMAEDGGVVLAHENCSGWGGEGPAQSLELLERVNSTALALIWDTGNPIGYGQDPWEFYTTVKEHVVYVHIKDGIRTEDGGAKYVLCGEGDARLSEVLQDLHERGYDGGISIEPHIAAIVHESKSASEHEEAFGIYVEYGRRLMALVEEAWES